MIAGGLKAKAHAGGQGHYIHPINLYVDLVYEGTIPPKLIRSSLIRISVIPVDPNNVVQ